MCEIYKRGMLLGLDYKNNVAFSLGPWRDDHTKKSVLYGTGQVVVWYLATDMATESDAQNFTRFLSSDEFDRQQRMSCTKTKKTYILAHAMKRFMLFYYFDDEPQSWSFQKRAHGKPELCCPNPLNIRFNLTHTDGFAVVALTRESNIGVDVERLGRKVNHHKLASKKFSTIEYHNLLRADATNQHEIFLRYWTLKEAYVKATGRGLTENLRQFYFSLNPPHVHFIRDNQNLLASHWTFFQLKLCENYIFAAGIHEAQRADAYFHIYPAPIDLMRCQTF